MSSVRCTQCGYVGEGRSMGCMQMFILVFLLLFGILPGILYALYADAYNKRCPNCDNKSLIPANSPRAMGQ